MKRTSQPSTVKSNQAKPTSEKNELIEALLDAHRLTTVTGGGEVRVAGRCIVPSI